MVSSLTARISASTIADAQTVLHRPLRPDQCEVVFTLQTRHGPVQRQGQRQIRETEHPVGRRQRQAFLLAQDLGEIGDVHVGWPATSELTSVTS
jgi:hypothetical protein